MTLKTHCQPSYIIRLSSNKFLWLQVLVGTQRLPKPLFFSLYKVHGYKPVKLAQYWYQEYAIYSCSSYGPTLGSYLGQHDIYLQNNARNIQKSLTICGSTYAVPTGFTAFVKCVFLLEEIKVELFQTLSMFCS